jgi:very-short-patch-repair endonuclease
VVAENSIPEVDGEPKAIVLNVSLISKLNLADFQNSIPVLRELTVVNDSPEGLSDLEVLISSEPPFIKPRTWRIDSIGSGKRCSIQDLDIKLEGGLLSRLTEAEPSIVTVSVHPLKDPGCEIARVTVTVELLPRNQWGGLNHIPDMVAAFVQPNEPAIDRVIKQASEILRSHGKSPALDGYSGGSKRVWELTSALWSAVSTMRLGYALPPASFEFSGQKVRAPGQIVDSGLATCLDLALFFSACLEQIGLNPIVVFTKGHALVGVWLKQEEFSTTVVDDVTAIRNRIRLSELVLFETTLITHEPPTTFSFATQVGSQHVSEEKEEAFELVVDIRRARLQRIKPLASADVQTIASPAEMVPITVPVLEEAPDLPDDWMPADQFDPKSLNPKDRLARWQRKLLDLSLRNNLLNFKAGKKALKLEAPDPGALEDLLADGQAIRILPSPDLMDGADPRSQVIFEGREREDLRKGHALDALKRREVFVRVAKEELETRLVDLYRAARLTLQEGGANTLYLAIGFLSWTREDKGEQRYKAPLILVPVSLDRKSIRSGFSLTVHEDEPRFNPTLIEMLRQDFGLKLGVIEGELPKDESGLDVASIWRTVSHAVKDIKGWEVTEDVVLSTFSFAKYLMWKDLAERTDQLKSNDVVRHLIDTPREGYKSEIAFPDTRTLDRDVSPAHTFCPLPADSSQLSAVVAGARGKDFVLIGPPGTGKSQTISNLIAQCLAEGKRVLFVSEKIAALDVVYRRLREVGLGEFCLELHSNKAKKLDVLAQLQNSWEARGSIDPDNWRMEAERLRRLREQLNGYVQGLHRRYPNGLTIYEAIGVIAGGESIPSIKFSWPQPATQSRESLDAMRDIASRLGVNAEANDIGRQKPHPFTLITQMDWSPSWQQRLIENAENAIAVGQTLVHSYQSFCEASGLPILHLTKRVREGVSAFTRVFETIRGREFGFLAEQGASDVIKRLIEGAGLIEKHRELNANLSPVWSESTTSACTAGMRLLADYRETLASLGQPWPKEVIDAASKAIKLLERIAHSTNQLSGEYSKGLESLNIFQIQRDWALAEKAMWPISWLKKRKLRAPLEAVFLGATEPDVARDIPLLADIQSMRNKVSEIRLGPETDGLWAGEETKQALLLSAIRLQIVIGSAHAGGKWDLTGFDEIRNGRAGVRLANELKQLTKLKELETKILNLEPIKAETNGLWDGFETQVDNLEAALRFIEERRAIDSQGFLQMEHAPVAAGKCGLQMALDLGTLRERGRVESALAPYSDLKITTRGLWDDLQTDLGELREAIQIHDMLAKAVAEYTQDEHEERQTRKALVHLLGEGRSHLVPEGSLLQAGRAVSNSNPIADETVQALVQSAGPASSSGSNFEQQSMLGIIETCRMIISAQSKLRGWCGWRKACQEASFAGLNGLAAGIENGSVSYGMALAAFETNYCRWWVNAVVDEEEIIRTFVSAEHEKRISDFRTLDDKVTNLTRSWIRARLCSELPTPDSVTKSSEWGLLRREMNKKKRHIPLRELMTQIPTALTKLTPCLLMSPLSIAQYLSADTSTFDVVVFDEASQIPVWDAIGAIARGKRVVMVGDPKQLPPTNFFDRAESDVDEEDVEGDLESILDECLGANLPTMHLAWHYRSRHESLIAFSNHRYYGGGLVTFPSPVTDDRAVSFHPVAGIYEKGGARINQPEAKALVADIVRRLKSPGFKQSKLTIGVVTFNSEQQALIEDLLDEERRRDPSIEAYFSESELEPLFVKNLESVQGDERDIMYFSITYGPDRSGAVSMNFGPMNREGGERRLNVAITRARHELRVFSSLKAEQMDLTRTQARGVADLKHFLEFAERGPRALAESTRGSQGDFESPFEEAVAAALGNLGWNIHTQVGASAFRVDLAVVHPDAPGVYLTGIECDGATYHRSATARDRDKLREQVLRGLGWEILRIWSTDWWIDKAGIVNKVHEKLNALLQVSREHRATIAEANPENEVATVTPIAHSNPTDFTTVRPSEDPTETLSDSGMPTQEVTHPEEPTVYAANASVGVDLREGEFMEADPSTVVNNISADRFFDRDYDSTLIQMITHVVAIEGPVLDAVLARRISRAHGWLRTGGRIQERVLSLAIERFKTSTEAVGTFFWPDGHSPDRPFPFRKWQENVDRPPEEISIQELVSLGIATMQICDDLDESLILMARKLRLSRLRANTRLRLDEAIRSAKGRGWG